MLPIKTRNLWQIMIESARAKEAEVLEIYRWSGIVAGLRRRWIGALEGC